ncbi:D-alanyl-D-alanine carboxypeptidase family protein [Eubacterium xylanophilum]|uniref:D-alanyl-D-alanine carboxypeptidase family protein n=1 Tax=Eubacterium xylanophilum TaxID=39497 RepID=UPI00047AB7F0|nr:serine hydrolase [Eubacterium xylanophilum]
MRLRRIEKSLARRVAAVALSMMIATSAMNGECTVDAKKKMTVADIKASYVVADATTGEILATHKAGKKVYPASTTKVLTICTILERMKAKGIKKNDYVKITKKMIKSVPSGSKCAYIRKGKKYTYRDLIGLVMVVSAADAVQALNKALYKSNKAFTKDMNRVAAKIGMSKSHFDNGIGLDKGNGYNNIYTTADDMMKLEIYASNNHQLINTMAKKKRIKVYDKSRKACHVFRSTNLFYRGFKYSKKRYKVVGMKTGYTSVAKHTLLTKTEAVLADRSLLVAVFNIGKKENVYKDTKLLLDMYS